MTKINQGTHENLFPNFYIINLPSIIVIQFIDGVGEIWQLVDLHKVMLGS